MKRFSKSLFTTVVLVFALAFLFAGTVQAKDNWYTKLRKANKKTYDFYRGIDLDGDGRYELFLSSKRNGKIMEKNKVQIWTHYKNKNVLLADIRGGNNDSLIFIKRSKKNRILGYYTRMSGVKVLYLYRLKKGKLVLRRVLGYYAPHHYTVKDNKKAVYTINGKKVKKSKWEDQWDKYYESQSRIIFYNRNK